MIVAYTGTPGSGKSMHMAKDLYDIARHTDYYIITNVPIRYELLKGKNIGSRYSYIDTGLPTFSVKQFYEISATVIESYHEIHGKYPPEGFIRLYIDEAQNIFNSRNWKRNTDKGWTEFFSIHRHLRFHIVLSTQYLHSIDSQVRALVEYEVTHRKVSRYGSIGWIISFGGLLPLFCASEKWVSTDKSMDVTFFFYCKKYGELMDSYYSFDSQIFMKEVSDSSGMV